MDGVGMAWDITSYAQVQQEGTTMAQSSVLNILELGMVRTHGQFSSHHTKFQNGWLSIATC